MSIRLDLERVTTKANVLLRQCVMHTPNRYTLNSLHPKISMHILQTVLRSHFLE